MVDGQCAQVSTNTYQTGSGLNFFVTLAACTGDSRQQFTIDATGAIRPVWDSNMLLNLVGDFAVGTAAATGGSPWVEKLDLSLLTPVVAPDCSAGLTGVISNVDQAAKSAVVGGTGKAGETITVTGGPSGAVTTVVAANGSWTATVTGLAEGDNPLSVTSSDNCAPVALSVIIEPLEIPIMHPGAAAAASVLGLGALGFGGLLRRRNTARI